ncbi:MAG: GntR family transcriptional regulator [Candidatus Latescibacteria bacterium]|nr:GntR family transcriptional regulator [Candidatus Latescibacterota bacterium]
MKASAKVVRWLEEQLPALGPGERLPPDRELASRLGVSVMTVRRTLTCYHRYPARALERLSDSLILTGDFGQVLGSQRDADIWIFSRDEEAIAGLNWARQYRLAVPSQLSIVGMENTPRFYHCGLSHCGPDWETIGYLMGHSLIGDFAIERTGRGYLRTRAWMVERLTTR